MNRVDVHLSVPTSPNEDECTWVHSLKIPVQDLIPLSRRPFKLIRYICFSLLSAHGDLSLSKQSPIPSVLYESDTVNIANIPPDGILNVYYHIQADERCHAFPLDPEIERLTVTTSSLYGQQPNFRNLVRERDGGICVATGAPKRLCDATHLIAVSKGDEYIRILTDNRSMNHPESASIDDINDIRNGLLLNKMIHVDLGRFIGFLPLPNEYMTHDDVDTPSADKSFITHDLTPAPLVWQRQPRSPLRIASEGWPPDILFDVVYASVVLNVWGADFASYTSPEWKKRFYGGTPVSMHDGGLNQIKEKQIQASSSEQRQQQNEDGEARYTQRSGWQATEPDTLDLLMTMHYLVHDRAKPPDRQDTVQCAESVQSKVQEWLGTVSHESEAGLHA